MSHLVKSGTVLAMSLVAASPAWAVDPFTIVALPDTQNYVNNVANAPLFTQQTQWIADQYTGANPRNIQFVTHLGDVVSTGSDLTQWSRADASMTVLDNIDIPYGILPGNHDYNSTGNKSTGTVNYVNNFGPTRFAGDAWYGGADPGGNNSYQTFSAGGYDFIHLALEWRPDLNTPFRDPSPIEWAQSILDANPDTPVILSTHEYIDDSPPGRGGTGDAMWDQLVKFNDQIFMVINGHNHGAGGTNDGEYHQVSLNNAGREVYEVLADYQDYPNGGDGWLRLIEFDIDNDQLNFETYSPVLDQYQTETTAQVGQFASQFSFNVDFSDRLDPVFIPPPPPPPTPDFKFQQGINGYAGTEDKEIRSSGGDSSNGQFTEISVDGDDGSPGLQPNQALIRFSDVVGNGPGQLGPTDDVAQAKLVLEVNNPGSGFTVYQMIAGWDEDTTWADFTDGVQPDGVEADPAVIAVFGSDVNAENVPVGTLEIDITDLIKDYQAGLIDDVDLVLIPFTNGTNGIDFYSSEYADLSARPAIEIFLVPEPTSLVLLGLGGCLLARRRR